MLTTPPGWAAPDNGAGGPLHDTSPADPAANPDSGGTIADLLRFWDTHGATIVMVALVAVGLFLLIALLVAWRLKRVHRWVAAVTWVVTIAISSEGMWEVAIKYMHLAPKTAAAVFFVGEAMLVNSMLGAKRNYKRTEERDPVTKKLLKAGDPGKHGRTVWLIATAIGTIVAFSADNTVECMIRFGIPLGAAKLYWDDLTSEGTTRPPGTFRWSPRSLMIRWGAFAGESQDLTKADRDRLVNALTRTARRVDSGAWPQRWHRSRLERLGTRVDVDQAMETEAYERLERGRRMVRIMLSASATSAVAGDRRGDRTAQPPTPIADRPVAPNGSASALGEWANGAIGALGERGPIVNTGAIGDRASAPNGARGPIANGASAPIGGRTNGAPIDRTQTMNGHASARRASTPTVRPARPIGAANALGDQSPQVREAVYERYAIGVTAEQPMEMDGPEIAQALDLSQPRARNIRSEWRNRVAAELRSGKRKALGPVLDVIAKALVNLDGPIATGPAANVEDERSANGAPIALDDRTVRTIVDLPAAADEPADAAEVEADRPVPAPRSGGQVDVATAGAVG